MSINMDESFDILISAITDMPEVRAIGISGKDGKLPTQNEGDIDLFIYCNELPKAEQRTLVLRNLERVINSYTIDALASGHWGIADCAEFHGIETWLMYFTIDEACNEVESILLGQYPDKVDNYYYPVGRLAMLRDIRILYDPDDVIEHFKTRLSKYPDKLSTIIVNYHLKRLIDTEDLERAVLRKDVLFYHFALDLALDSFLQALFALNKVYFPSRKRTLEYIRDFETKPTNCTQRILDVIRYGSDSENIEKSYSIWQQLVSDINTIVAEVART